MKEIRYEVVKNADSSRILHLYRAAGWWQEEDKPGDEQTISAIIANSFCFVIAIYEGEIIGMGRAISDGVSDAYIQDVTILEQHRGNGYGKGIMQKLLQYLREQGLQWIGLISEPGYERFYQALGFAVMKGYTPFLLSNEDI
ncbi:MAG: GNAT family N-acetyltransferase [Candidatus Cloacimonadaceae bacterium]|jgi:spermidine synthase|nr:GNAT family N-acetyltransferase [Candidatus Cloacimonadota bacterium]MDY0127772.1 GNAT family N-acetyltransferase [Candidatus Cloacimonadaceae bacterium]MCB5254662.1 GNAT family N-acetyltransferase [Candidatus Cloacimonadota bacterium]MCK9178159.1 GNAT family N-acetyltransferase [Candidatus Cloacimonadota bacterium]MCK9242018.1 GNAT family N-acetyltransferase [Candidatus Cloacimonadota bacterium]